MLKIKKLSKKMHYYIRSVQIYSVSKFKTVIGVLESSILGRLTQEFLKNYKKKSKVILRIKSVGLQEIPCTKKELKFALVVHLLISKFIVK